MPLDPCLCYNDLSVQSLKCGYCFSPNKLMGNRQCFVVLCHLLTKKSLQLVTLCFIVDLFFTVFVFNNPHR